MPALEDEFLGCGETPVWLPRTDFHREAIQVCGSCKLTLTAKIAGPGNVRASPEGLNVNENPTVSLTFNGKQHNLVQTNITFPAAHRLAETTQPGEAEILFYFQNYTEYNKIICLALPLTIGTTDTNSYFKTLGDGITPNRPTMASLFEEEDTFFTYHGADLRGRTADNSKPRDRCDPVQTVITYILAEKAATLARSDYNKLIELAGIGRENCNKYKASSVEMKELYNKCNSGPYIPAGGGPPKPRTDLSVNRMVKLLSRINGITLIDGNEGKDANGNNIPTTKSMKCYKLDKSKDIQDGKVYVGGKHRPGTRTLADELKMAATNPESSMEEDRATLKPKHIETWLGVILGVVIGVVVCATVIVFLWRRTFTNYGGVQKLYNVPISASQLALNPDLPSLPTICPKK